MSKLDELIAELCPDGVEFKTIGSCVDKIENIKWGDHAGETYRYIDLTSVDRDTHDILETQQINSETAPSRAQQIVRENDVLLGATRPLLKRFCTIPSEYDNEICSTGFCVLRAKEGVVLPRYLYHVISSTDFFDHVEKFQKGASYPAISDADTKRYKFPVPPLEVQREIVRVLDDFTLLSAELSAELSARRKQYEYYRNEMLTFDTSIPKIPLSDVTVGISSGKNKERLDDGIYPVYGSTGIISQTNTPVYDWQQILVARVGANAGYVHLAGGQYDVSDNTLIVDVKKEHSLKYVYYLLQNMNLNQYAKGGGQPLITAGDLKKMVVPMPKRDVQDRIVNVLDNFDAICSDLNIGLPAEINARQKQYEYYRDLLLTFVETGKTILTDRQTDRA